MDGLGIRFHGLNSSTIIGDNFNSIPAWFPSYWVGESVIKRLQQTAWTWLLMVPVFILWLTIQIYFCMHLELLRLWLDKLTKQENQYDKLHFHGYQIINAHLATLLWRCASPLAKCHGPYHTSETAYDSKTCHGKFRTSNKAETWD